MGIVVLGLGAVFGGDGQMHGRSGWTVGILLTAAAGNRSYHLRNRKTLLDL